jgi:23S rRNA (uracil1939-C5)-methyltransferase
MTAGEVFSVEIESLDQDGRGIGRRDGKAVFVEGALPGESVRYERRRNKPSYEVGRVIAIDRASVLRTQPRCPHFGLGAGACGGCSMQHLDARAQVSIKQRVLEDSLWHIGRVRPERMLRPIAGPAWRYRHRARLTVRHVLKKGGVLVGFHERSSSYVADMDSCEVLPARVSELLVPLRRLIEGLSIRDRLPQIEVAVADRAGETQIVLVLRVLNPPSDVDHARLAEFARHHGVELWLQPSGPQTAAPLSPQQPAELQLDLPEFAVKVPFGPTDFTQVNHGINQALVARALRLLDPQPHEKVVDFFCGLGNFTLPLATRAAHVWGIEGSEILLERARVAAQANALADRTSFVAANLFEWTAEDWDNAHRRAGGVDKVLIDPPREGALAVIRAVAASPSPPIRAVYVSCNPATLARDCAVLVHEAGWVVRAAGIVNMFPHTSHVESMAVLEPPAAGGTTSLASDRGPRGEHVKISS